MTDADSRPRTREDWLADAITATRTFIEREESVGRMELFFARPDTWDYDFEIDKRAHLECARETLAALQREAETIRSRARMRAERWGTHE